MASSGERNNTPGDFDEDLVLGRGFSLRRRRGGETVIMNGL